MSSHSCAARVVGGQRRPCRCARTKAHGGADAEQTVPRLKQPGESQTSQQRYRADEESKQRQREYLPEKYRNRSEIDPEEAERYIHENYNVKKRLELYAVDSTNSSDKKLYRSLLYDTLKNVRQSMRNELGPEVNLWTDLQVMTFNLPPPQGREWKLEVIQ